MQILSVFDEAFRPYGRVVEGSPVEGILKGRIGDIAFEKAVALAE